jgi:hypothetical protein
MYKQLFLTGAAAVGLIGLTPAVSAAQEITASGNIEYNNQLSHTLVQFHLNGSLTGIVGFVGLEGTIDADSAATAITDTKQILSGNRVTFREEAFREGRSGGVDSDLFGFQVDDDPDTMDNAIPIGYFAPIVNNVEAFNVEGAGNVGVNAAAGYYNAQQNDASLAVSGFSGGTDDDDSGGWSEASLLSLQLATDNYYGPYELPVRDPEDDDPLGGPGFDDYRDRNFTNLGTVSGDGNLGVNVATGAFNIQQNAMTLAVSEDSVLAKATAGVIQTALSNEVVAMNSVNNVASGDIGGAGNIGVNLAAGVGNMQHNSLTIATASGT